MNAVEAVERVERSPAKEVVYVPENLIQQQGSETGRGDPRVRRLGENM